MTLSNERKGGTMNNVSVSPHGFVPIRPWDNRDKGRCRVCKLRREHHPSRFWPPARAVGDKSPALDREPTR